MTYSYVSAYHHYGPRRGPVKAFVVHMAEGGGTVGFLSRQNPRGVSVHYVIEYSGRTVQMLQEREASGSINPNDLRTTNGPEPYGARIRRVVMGEWDRDPNAAVITLEMEGFAAAGPNMFQRASLGKLVNDVRSRYPTMGLLGHRDFQDYKPCPGVLIPWLVIGGHGPAGMEDAVLPVGDYGPFIVNLSAGDQLYDEDMKPLRKLASASQAHGFYVSGTGYLAIPIAATDSPTGKRLGFVKASEVEWHRPDAPPPADAVKLAPGVYRVE